MKNILLPLAILGLIAAAYLFGSGGSAGSMQKKVEQNQARSNVQTIEMLAKNGYSPKDVVVDSGRPIDLKVKTKNTFDCSADFRIKKLGIAVVLQPNNEETFQLPSLQPGETIDGSCGMGMYGFVIRARS